MKLFKTKKGNIVFFKGNSYKLLSKDWDILLNNDQLYKELIQQCIEPNRLSLSEKELNNIALPPIKSQEVWASGVTYFKSKTARMEESKESGGSTFYDKVYDAERPELFFKSTADRVRGPFQTVRIRKDSMWSVPEPELTLVLTRNQKLIGYSIGNDMSARDIEGENPLYLPQAKSYTGSAALGPCILVTERVIDPRTIISMEIIRTNEVIFEGRTQVAEIKRSFSELIHFLFKEMDFPNGCFLMTGTGIVPDENFTLQQKDQIKINIEGIGTLQNEVG
jgi:2-dehydro-3-deoxy-D-arabinonate dehydratase